MAIPSPFLGNDPQQLPTRTAPGTQRKPKTDLSLKRPSLKSSCPDDGRQYIQKKLGMLNRSQDATSPTMFLPSRPTSFSQHVLHRQPKLSSLGRPRELAEDHVSPRTTQLYAGALGPIERGPRDGGDWKSAAFQYDVAASVHTDSAGGLELARHSATSRGWEAMNTTPSTCGRRSSEWETETLLDHNGASEINAATYPCPFRKRNPVRFNIRDHETCARDSFGSIQGLKNHIITHHRRKPSRRQCRRCKQQFDTETELEEHLLLPRDQVCEVNIIPFDDPEDGTTDRTARILAVKDTTNDTWTWDGIWRIIFPRDLEIPDPDVQPVVELAEVQQAFDEGQDILKESLREKLQLLLPGNMDDNYLSFLTGQLELVFETHRINVMKQSLCRASTTHHGTHPSPTLQPLHHAPPQKPDRKSRRNTLLQSLHRLPPSDPPSARRHSRPTSTSASTGTRHASYPALFNTTPPHLRPTTTFLPSSPPHHETGIPSPKATATNTTGTHANRPTALTNEYNLNMNPRDSRDSGIGMTCDTCNQEEPCHCTGEQTAKESGEDETTTDMDPSSRSQGRMGGGSSHHQHQPRLSITTKDLGSQGARMLEGVEGGRFSPESFKQRVLRKGLFDVMG